jgi:hypothetical protein
LPILNEEDIPMTEQPDRNLALELVRVTEAAALAAARWMGRGDKNAADQAAVDAMRLILNTIDMQGIIVIGEGEKDEAPMLFNGEELGTGIGLALDIAVDPIDGTTLTAMGGPGALSVVAMAERGTMYCARQPGLYEQDRGGRRGARRDRHQPVGGLQSARDRPCPGQIGRRPDCHDPGTTPTRKTDRGRAQDRLAHSPDPRWRCGRRDCGWPAGTPASIC